MRAVTSALSLSVLVPLASLSSQVQPEPGTRVRVTGECTEQYTATSNKPRNVCRENVGMFESVADGSIVLTLDESGTRLAVPFDSVTRFDVFQGRKANVGKGALWGGAVGVGLGVVTGALWTSEGDLGCTDRAGCVGFGAAAFGVIGLLVGTPLGAFIKTDKWEEIPLEQLPVSVVPQRDGRLGIGFSVVFWPHKEITMRAVLSLSLVALLATTPAASQTEGAVGTDQPYNLSMVVAATFESAHLTAMPEPASAGELLLRPGALPSLNVDEPLAVPAPAPVSTTGKVAIVAGVIVVLLGVLVAIGISNQGWCAEMILPARATRGWSSRRVGPTMPRIVPKLCPKSTARYGKKG